MTVISDKQWRDLRISEKREPAVCGWSDFFYKNRTAEKKSLCDPAIRSYVKDSGNLKIKQYPELS